MKVKTWKMVEKKQRNESLLKYKQEHPDITVRALAKIFKISSTRVHQIVSKERCRAVNSIEASK